MSREWKPGDVAAVVWNADAKPEILFRYLAGDDFDMPAWMSSEDGEAYPRPDQLRPLVVIDPEDREQVERLADAMWSAGLLGTGVGIGNTASAAECRSLAAALRSLITPPRPDEPTGLGAVVEDEDGRFWVRHSNTPGAFPWLAEGQGVEGWSNITAVRILSEGVKP